MISFDELKTAFEPYSSLHQLPDGNVQLWSAAGCGVWLTNDLGPAIPYPPVDHGDGTKNHGYRRLKDNIGGIDSIPEVAGWPEYASFLRRVNSPASPLETVGCEKGYFPQQDSNVPPIMLGSYIDVIFTDLQLNDDPHNFLKLASQLAVSVTECESWWANISFVLQRLRGLSGTQHPWGMMLHIQNYGSTEEEARKFWGESLKRISQAVKNLDI